MRLELRQRGIEMTENLRNHVRVRIESALRRFAHSVKRVRVYLSDVNGPRGGTEKRCRIAVELPRRRRVVVTALAPDIFTAITRAASRTKFAVRRRIKRRLARRRPAANGAGRPTGL